ncbi:unnamed protein product [Fusarium venenatum]|uniref:Uncharacterized protein n=1 Tax=Fusarium venenatum TaxID=56646 RepID=A0A2L2SYL2_9HYPO|nr:uncharacterized protein FVRRES_07578 [Fusarium venenatum]CEI63142.1 unnamed protein product [Fusarium venenatum]
MSNPGAVIAALEFYPYDADGGFFDTSEGSIACLNCVVLRTLSRIATHTKHLNTSLPFQPWRCRQLTAITICRESSSGISSFGLLSSLRQKELGPRYVH